MGTAARCFPTGEHSSREASDVSGANLEIMAQTASGPTDMCEWTGLGSDANHRRYPRCRYPQWAKKRHGPGHARAGQDHGSSEQRRLREYVAHGEFEAR